MYARFAVIAVTLVFAVASDPQNVKAPYPSMAPIEQYLMDRDGEISLARSAAPEAISRDAKVLLLGRHGYETAVEGREWFCVCRGTSVDGRFRLFGVLESQNSPGRSLKRLHRTIHPADYFCPANTISVFL
jgi:hypothetical protein